MTTISEALDRDDMLAPYFAGDTWSTWRAVLRAAEGLLLDAEQLAAFRSVAGDRDPPAHRVRELWCVVGRRGGKDSIASAIATVAALGDYRDRLRPGERAVVMCLACDRQQAAIVHRYIAGYFSALPLLAPLVERETADGIELTTGVEIVVSTNSFRAVRGRTIVCAIFDEAAYWRADDSATPDVETYQAVLPGMVTLPGSMLIGISSPYRRSGLLFERWRAAFGQPDDDVLVVHGASRAFNPSLPQSIVDAALERDPAAGAAEWLAEWRSDLADFVDRQVVEDAVIRGRHEVPPERGSGYQAFVDPSGGSSDSMTLGIAHRDPAGPIVLDLLREVRPPFSPAKVTQEFAGTIKAYGLNRVTGDNYAGEWPKEQFRKHGVEYIRSDKTKGKIYLDALPLLNSGTLQLLDNQRLVSQLCALERRTARGSADSIDHPRGAHDDLANAALGAAVLVGARAQPVVITEKMQLWAKQPWSRGSGGRVAVAWPP